MSRSLTDVAPAGLVPAAWAVTLGAHVGVVPRRTLFIALCVMDALLVAFAVAAREEMTGPVLGLWQRVLLVGLAANLVGTVDMAVDAGADPLLPVALYAWMVVPGLAYLATGRAVGRTAYGRVYLAGGACSLLGALVYTLAPVGVAGRPAVVAGLVAVGAGQTAGIVAAAVQNG